MPVVHTEVKFPANAYRIRRLPKTTNIARIKKPILTNERDCSEEQLRLTLLGKQRKSKKLLPLH